MNSRTRKNLRVVVPVTAMMLGMVGLVSYAPTLYRMFCNLTGYGGTIQRAAAATGPASASGRTITVRFDANVAPDLPWTFRPEQRSVEAVFGEPTKVYYYARNDSDRPIVARATFNVTPYKAAPYFFKIECFCFTEERLGPGESARMPLVLFVDGELLKDKGTREVKEITLSYTFFGQFDLSEEEMRAARDLGSGSKTLDRSLDEGKTVRFDNDAPRR